MDIFLEEMNKNLNYTNLAQFNRITRAVVYERFRQFVNVK